MKSSECAFCEHYRVCKYKKDYIDFRKAHTLDVESDIFEIITKCHFELLNESEQEYYEELSNQWTEIEENPF